MSVFISYSSKDSSIADKIAKSLVDRNVHVWIDKWELTAGDSLITKIEQALSRSQLILALISKNSLSSPWCEKELNSGQIRELEERNVIVVPVILDDCTIPLFMKDKLYVDLRSEYENGILKILEAIDKHSFPFMARFDFEEYITDWAIDFNVIGRQKFEIKLTFVDHYKNYDFSVLSVMTCKGNKEVIERCDYWVQRGALDVPILVALDSISNHIQEKDIKLQLVDQHEAKAESLIKDISSEYCLSLSIKARRLGNHNGKNILLSFRDKCKYIKQYIDDTTGLAQND